MARLALSDRPLARSELAALLFGDAADPLGALRWSLADARRAIGDATALTGDPLSLPATLVVDARELDHGGPLAVARAEHAGELLAGLSVAGCPEFEAWLLVERRRLQARAETHLREAALQHLATGEVDAAVRFAGRAVVLNPLDEALQELLVRALSRSGDPDAANDQYERAARLLRDELGVDPSPALRAALRSEERSFTSPAFESPSNAVVEALLESGNAAVGVGAVDAGIETLRQVAAIAEDPRLRARALASLGSALVHGIRGRDEEGALLLHEALVTARGCGDDASAVVALRELAFVDVLAGRAATIDEHIDAALALAADDAGLRAGVLGVRGMHWSDRGHLRRSLEPLLESVAAAEQVGNERQAAWSRAIAGRAHVLLDEPERALALLDVSVNGCRSSQYHSFLPFPLAVRAQTRLALGDVQSAEEDLQIAFALGCQLGDPCWEAAAARGLALVALRRGDNGTADDTIVDAYRRCVRFPDSYVWIEAWVLEADVSIAEALGDADRAERRQAQLHRLAARTEQPWFLRAHSSVA